jgi:hypothetical protein
MANISYVESGNPGGLSVVRSLISSYAATDNVTLSPYGTPPNPLVGQLWPRGY